MQLLLRIGSWRTKWTHAISLLLLIVIWTPLVQAAEGKRVAFVVGIGTYDNLGADKQLRNAVNDAEGVSAKLAGIGYQVTKAPDLTRSVFSAKWQNVLDSLTRDDTFVLYFSGHGVQIDGQNYLLMRDIPWIEYGRQAQLTREAISLNEILSDLTTGARAHPKQSVVILDACRNNPLIPPGYKGIQTASGLAKPSATEGLFVIYSASENSVSLDRLANDNNSVKYSVFTRALLPLLTQPLTLQDLSVELKKNVLALTKRAQRPTYYDGTDGEPFCLPGCLTEADKSSVRFKENLTASVHPSLSKELTGKDGAPMVLMPVGSFQMGSTKDEVDRAIQTCVNEYKKDQQTCEDWYKGELPRHQVSLDAFYFDKYEVTNRLFQRFVQETGYRTTAEEKGSAWAFVEGKGWEEVKGANWQKPEAGATVLASNRTEHPVVAVSWDDAVSFCRWAGKRLPAEAEFEYAMRAGTTTQYWWGQGNPGTRRVENIADESAKHLLNVIMKGYNDGAVRTAPVGSYEANPWGLHDMSGNVREWTADWYDEGYYGKGPERNPKGPSSGQYRVLRGGSWADEPGYVRSASRGRAMPTTRLDGIGFRCAQDIPN
ncbi:MAG: SUMF1/EgtB/PvdO family nonheme iron enzyme [Nitrospira sp.]|nr:SUMF1/EgtB/PvdO family nonheme iron enzyme [Nitrospira sp.]